MNEEQQLKLQAFLDGELPEDEAREVAAELARDAGAAALMKELRNTREALKASQTPVTLPESREFYWSKIAREIERQTPKMDVAQPEPFFSRFRQILVGAGAAAAVVVALLISVGGLRNSGVLTEMTIADAGAFTYHDYNNGTTLVWVSYPAESEFAEGGSR